MAWQALLGRFRSSTTMTLITNLMALGILAINVVLVIQFLDGANRVAVGFIGLYAIVYFTLCLCMLTGAGPAGSLQLIKRWASGGRHTASTGSINGGESSPGVSRAEVGGTAPLVAAAAPNGAS